MKPLFNRFIKDESGATAIEYGLIAALVAVAIIAALNAMTGQLNAVFTKVSDELTKAANVNTSS
jgi:pilus assembly protein Flp/PilA